MLWFDMNTDHSWDPLKIRSLLLLQSGQRMEKEVGISAKQAAWVSGQIMDYEREGRAPMELTDWVWQPDDPSQQIWLCYRTEALSGRPVCLEDYRERKQERESFVEYFPRADGTIPQEQIDVLLAIGKWLDVNGEAIILRARGSNMERVRCGCCSGSDGRCPCERV